MALTPPQTTWRVGSFHLDGNVKENTSVCGPGSARYMLTSSDLCFCAASVMLLDTTGRILGR